MSTVIRLELDSGPWPGADYERAWPVGGEVTGHLIVKADDGQRATNTRVELEWKTSGRGTSNSNVVTQQVLQEGDIPPQSDLRLPFKLAVPNEGPISYHGHMITIGWSVVGRIDISWAVDKTTTSELSILPIYDHA